MFSRRSFMTSVAAAAAVTVLPRHARAATRKLRLGHNNTTTSLVQAHAEAFAKTVASLSEGRLAIEIYPLSQLGTEQQMLKAVSDGSLDLTLAPIGVTGEYSKETSLLELPYLFKGKAAARAALAGPLGVHCTELLKAKSIVNLGWGEIGLRNFTANKPIRSVADIQGLKIRVPLSQPILQTFKAMGAAPEILPFGQLQEALRTGRFDAQENPISVIIGGGLDKVQTHLSLTGHVYTASLIAISADVAEEMTAADLQILHKAGAAGAEASQQFSDNADLTGLETLRKGGMTVVEDVNRASFEAAAAAAGETLAAVFGGDAIKQIRGFVG